MMRVNVMDYGARCDGKHDDRDALAKAILAAQRLGATVIVPGTMRRGREGDT